MRIRQQEIYQRERIVKSVNIISGVL